VRADESAAGELGELARGFNDAAESVERSAAQRRQMAADVAHELRTPLAALQAGLEEVRDGLVPVDVATLTRLHAQTLRLGRVIDDLRLLSAPEEESIGRLSGRVDLGRVVADELSARGPELRAAGVELRDIDLARVDVVADADRMHQVVGNLLANCARHCRPGDAVDVVVAQSGADALVRVSDTGPGIAEADLPRVFDRYWRGPGGAVGGSGLGLAVVREIVTAHHGTADVAAPAGGGTVVTIRLPAAGHP
jgi:two-component system sensor histidine kinase BaeS